jgi:hypothetical protein
MTRVYADTSVFGGLFDVEFQRATKAFFEGVNQGRYTLVTSVLVARELHVSPRRVREFFRRTGPGTARRLRRGRHRPRQVGSGRAACRRRDGERVPVSCELELQTYRPF